MRIINSQVCGIQLNRFRSTRIVVMVLEIAFERYVLQESKAGGVPCICKLRGLVKQVQVLRSQKREKLQICADELEEAFDSSVSEFTYTNMQE